MHGVGPRKGPGDREDEGLESRMVIQRVGTFRIKFQPLFHKACRTTSACHCYGFTHTRPSQDKGFALIPSTQNAVCQDQCLNS